MTNGRKAVAEGVNGGAEAGDVLHCVAFDAVNFRCSSLEKRCVVWWLVGWIDRVRS